MHTFHAVRRERLSGALYICSNRELESITEPKDFGLGAADLGIEGTT